MPAALIMWTCSPERDPSTRDGANRRPPPMRAVYEVPHHNRTRSLARDMRHDVPGMRRRLDSSAHRSTGMYWMGARARRDGSRTA
jgi:hypothetical protein